MTYELSNEQIKEVAPSVFADRAYSGVSSRYMFISTSAVVDRLRQEGFTSVHAQQSRARSKDRHLFTRHLLRFRQGDLDISKYGAPSEHRVLRDGPVYPEIVLINGHDGGTAYSLFAGLFRLVCTNGLVVAKGMFAGIYVRHTGNILNDVVEATHEVTTAFPMLANTVERWRSIPVPIEKQYEYAQRAIGLRWQPSEIPFEAENLLSVKRAEDAGDSLWAVYNRVQENLVKGGQLINNRARHQWTRGIKAIDNNVRINRALWALTDEYAATLV